ncbi:MAG: crossover junction endodeoxyribonuclease RuvC [Clostridia bacterium]|nr:crossover junction endodeoxyribonuclease RuvC [Clostridia bacterium]
MIILGIDPGIAIVGWGVIEFNQNRFRTVAYGAITTEAGQDVELRLNAVYEELCEIIEYYHPDEMAVEELFFTNNVTTGIPVAEARGVILLAGIRHGLRIAEYTPMQVKAAISGYGKAEKSQVMTMVTQILRLKSTPKPDDTADALAIAVCHAHSAGSRLAVFYNQKKTRLT